MLPGGAHYNWLLLYYCIERKNALMRRLILVPLLIFLALLAIVGGVGYWLYNNYTYYSTDDAQVSGQIVSISSPQAGQLTNFAMKVGDQVTAGQVVATITTVSPATGKNKSLDITSPIAGTVVQASAVQGEMVSPGPALIQVTNLHNLQVTAYIDENVLNNVQVNQAVDIHIDAYHGTTYTGHVQSIVQAAAGEFSLLPTSDNSSGNFTKVGQRIPVIVTLDGTGGNDLMPGMSAEVTIHLH
jgi:multidrug resistance efflux pump